MPEKDTEVLFPVAGLNVATEFGRQPKQTTPEGENVRAYEALTERGRGGSRPGLSKFISTTVPAGAHLIQHMNVVVDPQAPSLLAGSEVSGDTFPDPDARWGGRPVRVGGDAITPNRNLSRTAIGNPTVQIVEAVGDSESDAGAPPLGTQTFIDTVPAGRIIVVFASCNGRGGAQNTLTVTNGDGTEYTHIVDSDVLATHTDTAFANDPIVASAAAYYLITSGVTGDSTVNVQASVIGELEFVAVHCKDQSPTNPIGIPATAAVDGDRSDADVGTINFGSVTVGQADSLVLIGARLTERKLYNVSAAGGFNTIPNGFLTSLYTASKANVAAGVVSPTADTFSPPTVVCYAAITLFLRSA